MGPVYVKTSNSRREWEQISAKFEERWNLPNILGAIDGKRIILERSINSGWRYHDYKGNDSVILMDVVGPEYEFLNVDVGMNGRMSHGGNWSRNSFRKAVENENNPLRIPPPILNHYQAGARASLMSLLGMMHLGWAPIWWSPIPN